MSLVVGFDGGGSKTACTLLTSQGVFVANGLGGACNLATQDDDILRASVRDAFQDACANANLSPSQVRLQAVCAGVAGYSAEARRAPFLEILRSEIAADRYDLQPDYAVAFWGASEGEPGIVVIAGTGAVAFGCNEKGETAREDGLGYLLGDRGSGFNLGLYALRHTLEQLQNGKTDALALAILKATQTRIAAELMHWFYRDFSPARVAALAPAVGELAEAGDAAARALAVEMARRLRHTVRSVRHRLWLPRDTPVYPLGGLWELGAFFRNEFQEPHWLGDPTAGIVIAPEEMPGGRFQIATPRHDAAYGAALCALRQRS